MYLVYPALPLNICYNSVCVLMQTTKMEKRRSRSNKIVENLLSWFSSPDNTKFGHYTMSFRRRDNQENEVPRSCTTHEKVHSRYKLRVAWDISAHPNPSYFHSH